MKRTSLRIAATVALWSGVFVVTVQPTRAQIDLIEAGHMKNQLVDSTAPLDPGGTQALLESLSSGDIESIGVHPTIGDLYIQLQSPGGDFTSTSTDIFKVTPAGVVSVVRLGTGFGINSRGTDLHFDPTQGLQGLLVTQDQNFVSAVPFAVGRVATVDPGTGMTGTWTLVPPFLFSGNTFGMDFSAGVGGTDVAASEIVFTNDGGSGVQGVHSAPITGLMDAVTTHTPPPVKPGDDIVIQPGGDWVHVGDFDGPLTAYDPAGPDPHSTVASAPAFTYLKIPYFRPAHFHSFSDLARRFAIRPVSCISATPVG